MSYRELGLIFAEMQANTIRSDMERERIINENAQREFLKWKENDAVFLLIPRFLKLCKVLWKKLLSKVAS